MIYGSSIPNPFCIITNGDLTPFSNNFVARRAFTWDLVVITIIPGKASRLLSETIGIEAFMRSP